MTNPIKAPTHDISNSGHCNVCKWHIDAINTLDIKCEPLTVPVDGGRNEGDSGYREPATWKDGDVTPTQRGVLLRTADSLLKVDIAQFNKIEALKKKK